jgi:HD superfamily phosphohydrolase
VWLLHALTVHAESGRLAVTWKGVSAVEAYLQSRYHMYRNVYFHKVVRSAEGMVKLALQRAKRLAVQERLAWPPAESVVHRALMGRSVSTDEFVDLDDISMLHCFKVWQSSDDPALAGLCRGLLFRRVYKTIDLTHLADAGAAQSAADAATDAVARAGGDGGYDLFYDEPSEAGYEPNAREPCGDAEIAVLRPDGSLTTFGHVSPLTEALDRQLMFRRLHVAAEWKDVAASALRD